MKKIVLIFAALVLCGLTIKAQLRKSHDSAGRRDVISRLILSNDTKYNYPQGLKSAAVYQKLDSAVRPNLYKDCYIYDNEKRNIQHIFAEWQNLHWVNSDKEEYFYDINGNISSVTGYTWDASTSQWINNLKGKLTYNNDLISSLIFLEWINNQWINSYKCDYTYNLNHNCTSEYWYDWDAITTQWNSSDKSDYMYDNYGKRIQELNWYYKMPYSVTTKSTYLYDTSGNMVLYTVYDWNESMNTWVLSYKGEFTYDLINRPILTIHSLPVGVDQWENSRKIDYTYSYTISPNNLILPFARDYYYDEYIDITSASYTVRRWDENTNDWYLSYTWNKYFSDFTSSASQLTVSTNTLNIGSTANSTNTFNITSNLNWTAASNESWLTVSDQTGTGNKTITLTAAANPASNSRTATVTVSATGVPSQTINITQAGSSNTVAVTAGGLSSVLSSSELNSTVRLTLSGSIDARDFKTMRDKMPLLAEIDLNGVTIAAYTGTEGTAGTTGIVYLENAIPQFAFSDPTTYLGKNSLTSFIFPPLVTSIGANAFYNCRVLVPVSLPSQITSIGQGAFNSCIGLISISIPSSVSYIGSGAFVRSNCSITVDPVNLYYSAIDGLLFNKTQSDLLYCPRTKKGSYIIPSTVTTISYTAFYFCTDLTSVVIPSTVKTIGYQAFNGCSGLTTVNIPSSVTMIGANAFNRCSGLTSIYSNWLIPLNLNSYPDVFYNVDKTTCILYVPYGTRSAYIIANQWQDFTNIVEMPGFALSAATANVAATQSSTASVELTSNISWSASFDKTWLIVSPTSGNGNRTLTFTADANPLVTDRTATITVSATGVPSQTINITQAGSSNIVAVTAGGLSSVLSSSELNSTVRLTLSGSIDARDFKTMRDKMPLLAEIDLNGVTIAAYTGTEGTAGTTGIVYLANAIPQFAFSDPTTYLGKNSLTSFIFPPLVTSIGANAFYNCRVLVPASLPSQITSIGQGAFNSCIGLISISIPSSVSYIGSGAFVRSNCSITVDPVNLYYSAIDGLLFNKTQSDLLYCPRTKKGIYIIPSTVTAITYTAFYFCTDLTSVVIPSSVTSISAQAFNGCSGLTSINIPSSVTMIGANAFNRCSGLTSIYSNWLIPLNLNSYPDVFYNVDKTTCILYVPYGTRSAYIIANQWQDFTNIVEMPGFALSAATANVAATQSSTSSVELTSNISWSASSDKTWLIVSPTSGNGNRTLTFTADANPLVTDRTATVTVSATGVPSQTIIVTQPALGMQVTVFLEGAYVGSGLMNTALKAGALVPLSQPYNIAPWNYAGTEMVASIPADVVDWVLVELRQAATPEAALPVTTTLPGWPKAFFLKSDGKIVDLDGTTLPAIGNPTITGNLYVIIRHRNHVAIMSAAGMTLSGSNYVYNFTDAVSKAYGGVAGYRQIVPGVFGMVSGDPDADGEISVLDFSDWAANFGKTGVYIHSDIDEDGQVSVLDYSKWATNFGVGNIPPLKLKKSILQGTVRKFKSQVPDVK